MTWDELRQTPAPLIHDRLRALQRRREREVADIAEALAMSGDVAWGRKLRGKPPKEKPDYWFEDTPFARWLQEKRLVGAGYSPLEAHQIINAERIREENKRNLQRLMN